MYKNYEIKDDEIKALKEENIFLKEEIARLNSKIVGLNSVDNAQGANINSPMLEYYLTRYNEIHNFVLANRLQEIDNNIESAEEKYNELLAKENMYEEIVANNNILEEQIQQINTKIEENNTKLSSSKTYFDEIATIVTNKENNIYNTTINYYKDILSKLSFGDMEEAQSMVKFVIDVLKYSLYDEIVNYRQHAKEAIKKLDDLNILEYEIKNSNTTLEIRKQELESKKEKISYEEQEAIQESLAEEIVRYKTSKEELINLFEQRKTKNIKAIKDEIKHLQILEYTNQQIALELDNFVLKLKEEITDMDTTSNILFTKQQQLEELESQIIAMEPFKNTLDDVEVEYSHLQKMYELITNSIEEIQNFTSSFKKLMDVNHGFYQTIKEYNVIKTKKVALKQNLDVFLIRERNLVETRRQTLNDPYGKNDLIKIDNELKDVQTSISTTNAEILSLDSKLYSLKDTEQDKKVIETYDEYSLCEQNLPLLLEKQKNLNSKINEKYIELTNLKAKCASYDELQTKIINLKKDINNI